MNLVRWPRIWSFGWQGLVRHAIINVALTLMMVSAVVIVSITVNEKRHELERQLDITIFIKEAAAEEDVLTFTQRLQERSEVQEMNYANKERAKQAFVELNAGDEELIKATEEIGNPFPRYIQLKPKDPQQLSTINSYVLDPKFSALVDTTSFENTKEAIDTYINFSKFVMKDSLVLAGFLMIVSVVVVMNIIRVAIFSRREEIGIMRMVGASHQLIRLPFVVEGLLFGAFAAAISLLLFLAAAYWEGKQIPLYFPYSTTQPVLLYKQYFGVLLWSNFGLGMLMSALISYVAVRRYLKQ